MKTLGNLAVVASMIASIGAATVAQAHGIWFAQRANQLALIYGVGPEDLDMVKRMHKVRVVAAYDDDGKEMPTQLVVNGALPFVNIDDQPAIVAATLDNGLWSRTPDGKEHNKGKDEVPDAKTSEHTFKYTVYLRRLNVVPPVMPAHKLQIVPVARQIPEQMGQPLTVRVLYEGKPVQGANVKADYVNDPNAAPLTTGADGTVTIKLRNQGLNVIVASFKSAPTEPAKSNFDGHTATLSFVLPHVDE